MSTIMEEILTCAVCGKESGHVSLSSSNCSGEPDLDFRPSEMLRSTMGYWINECPHCGYASGSLDDPTSVDEGWLKTEAYHSANTIAFTSILAKSFYKSYLIKIKDNNYKDAFYAALHAAWACDDSNDIDSAIVCRKAALEQLDLLIASDATNSDSTETYRIIRMDLLRRIGLFSEVISEYSNVMFSSDLSNQIREFQLYLAQQCDTNCYTVEDCFNK